MKRTIILGLLVILNYQISPGQHVKEGKVLYEGSLRESVKVSVDIPEEEVKSQLNDFASDKFDSGLDGYGLLAKKDEVMTDFRSMPLLAEEAIRLIGVFKENGTSTDLYLIGQWESEEFVTKKKDRPTFENLLKTGHEFLHYFVPEHYAAVVEESQNVYKDALEDVNGLEEDISKKEEDLMDARETVTTLEHELIEMKKELKTLEDTMRLKERQAENDQDRLEKAKQLLTRSSR